jgi:putative transposase
MFMAQPHRRSIRLTGRDYSWPGTYFVTICTAERKRILGRIEDGTMPENVLGRLVRTHWMAIPREFASVELDAFTVMPNHVHGLIHLHRRVTVNEPQYKPAQFAKPDTASITWIVRAFKARVTREARQVLRRPELTVWQRNYFERIVRTGQEYKEVYRYIFENPKNWDQDEENPQASNQT